MIPGGMPKTRVNYKRIDSKKGLLLSVTLVAFIIGGLAIMMFTGGNEGEEEKINVGNFIPVPSDSNTGNTENASASGFSDLNDTEVEQADGEEENQPDEPDFFIHKLKSGENFSTIAGKYYNDRRKFYVIQKANPNLNPKTLQIGAEIKVPNLNKTRNPEQETESNNSSSNTATNNPPKKKNNGITVWPINNSNDNEEKNNESKPEKKSGKTWWDNQDQPSVPDDQNTGSMKKIVICKATTHVASRGDSPMSLAMKYYGRIDLKNLIENANPMIDWYNLKGGQSIVIPEFSEMRVVSPKPEKDLSSKRDENAGDPIIETPAETNKNASKDYEIYVVKDGDSLWTIAEKKLGNGTKYKEIMELNGMTSENVSVGMRLKLPKR